MRFIILIVIVVVAAAAGYFALQLARNPQAPQQIITQQEPAVEATNILVARTHVPVGTIITEEMVDQQPWPKHLLLQGFIESGSPESDIVGSVARTEFQAQEPFNKDRLVDAKDANFIAASLPAGMRALTLAVDAISGVAGYIFPGDHVDLMLTHNIPNEIAEGRSNKVRMGYAETLLDDVTVVAVDSRTITPQNNDQRQQAEVKVPTNVTIAVTPEQAQQVRLAEKNGTLSLVLRSLEDRNNAGKPDPTEVTSLIGGTSSVDVVIIRGVDAERAASNISAAPIIAPMISPPTN